MKNTKPKEFSLPEVRLNRQRRSPPFRRLGFVADGGWHCSGGSLNPTKVFSRRSEGWVFTGKDFSDRSGGSVASKKSLVDIPDGSLEQQKTFVVFPEGRLRRKVKSQLN